MYFQKFIKAVGTGPKGNKDLSLDEINELFEKILNQELSQAQIAAFLIAFRVKLETNEELKGVLKALQNSTNYQKVDNSLLLGYSFDGVTNNPYLFPLYEDILSNFYKKNSDIRRLNLVVCVDEIQPATKGVTTKDIALNLDKGQYLHIFDRIEFLPKLSALTKLRNELCLRTAFNTVEKLVNVSQSEFALTSVFHKPYVAKYLDIFENSFKDLTIIRGSQGSVEVFKDSKYWQKVDGKIEEFSFCLKDFGVSYKSEFENISLNECLNLIKEPTKELLDLAKFNVALLLLFSKRVKSLDEAWQRLN